MRVLKFRAWDEGMKNMVYQGSNTTKNNGWVLAQFIFDELDVGLIGTRYSGETENIFNFELMQYTGIKDEHGSEIYEGDILKWSSEDTDGSMMESLEKVVYRDGCFVLENKYGEITDLLKDGIKYNEEYEKVELVGNVYENAELLEGDHNE